MLRRLYISNFALINEMDVLFPGKLTVITGETGAGKSIFLEALSLVLGQRADSNILHDKSRKCVIEAVFDTRQTDLKVFFEKEGIDPSIELILRREINPEGRSRSFLNDTPVNLGALKHLSEKLIDIHSQHQNLLLNQSDFQLEVVDAFAGSTDSFLEYTQLYNELSESRSRLMKLKEEEARARKEQDYLLFLHNEFGEIEIKPRSVKELEEEGSVLENAEAIKEKLVLAANALSGGEKDLVSELSRIRQILQQTVKLSEKYTGYLERINAILIEIKDLGSDLGRDGEEIFYNPERMQEVNGLLDQLNRLMKKHHVNTEEALIRAKDEIEAKLSDFSSLEKEIQNTETEIASTEKKCFTLARKISGKRLASIHGMEKEIGAMLSGLSMPNAVFKIDHLLLDGPGAGGIDRIRFLFSANKGSTPQELQKIASGGELSRVMLTLKSLLASRKGLPAIIFDEIDSGVSGDVADKIGSILRQMGKNMQVICITHLPQIASKGSHHLYVYKTDDDRRTTSHIKELLGDERITEIAKMLSTGKPSPSALKNAKELLNMN